MPRIPSAMGLHLRYRLWIAELNLDINILRIFSDYISEITSKRNEEAVKTKLNYFETQFISARKEIDNLRHEMHLLKMKLATYSKEMKRLNYKTYQSDNHTDVKRRYVNFRKIFNRIKDEFRHFEGELL